MVDERYKPLQVKNETKEILDEIKRNTGQPLTYIVHKAVTEYNERHKEGR